MIVIYARHHSIEQNDDHETLEDAISCLKAIEDYDQGYALGVYDPSTKTIHIPENMDIAGRSREQVLKEKLAEFQELELQIENIEYYER